MPSIAVAAVTKPASRARRTSRSPKSAALPLAIDAAPPAETMMLPSPPKGERRAVSSPSETFCAWAKTYYQLQRGRGKGHHAAVRALAFKWLRIIWRCWQDRVPYDDAMYTQALIARGSPIAISLRAAA